MKLHTLNLSALIAIAMSGGAAGCLSQSTESEAMRTYSPQQALGVGIVKGTLGAQSALVASRSDAPFVKGQVLRIEGAAYVVRDLSGRERRLPVDENTAIDRPAHVGDWVGAYLDSGGRATSIRNIDEEVRLQQRP